MQITRHLLLLTGLTFLASAQVQHLTYFKLPGVTGVTTAEGCAVNESGVVAATILSSDLGRRQAYVMDKGTFRVLEDLPGYSTSIAEAINARGDVLGSVASGIDWYDRPAVIWKDGIPSPISLPPLSGPASRRLVQPLSLDDAGRVLAGITEYTPANQPLPIRYYVLHGSSAVELPLLQPGGPITAVYFSAYKHLLNSGEAVGIAMVTRLGQLRMIGFIHRKGQFTEVLVDDLYTVGGVNQKGEVFGQLYNNGFYVWKDGQVRTYAPLIASDLVFSPSSWNNKGQTCVALRPFRYAPNNVRENAILSFGDADGAKGNP